MFSRILAAVLLSFALGAATLVVAARLSLAQSPTATDQQAPAATPAPVPSATPAPSAETPVPSTASPDSATAPVPSPAASVPPPAVTPAPAAADAKKLKDEKEKAAAKKEAEEKAKKEAEEKEKKEKIKEAKKELFEHENTEPAKKLFSAVELPSIGKAVSIGYYPRGCLQGGVALPTTGKTWQVMRLSRNRNWGNPELVHFLERFAPRAAKATGWHGILIGDMAQPRGGPLPFGHLSHQSGLDVDIWFMPLPRHVLTREEREQTSASNLVSADWKHIAPKTWSPVDVAFIRTAAEQPEVERVLVNAAI